MLTAHHIGLSAGWFIYELPFYVPISCISHIVCRVSISVLNIITIFAIHYNFAKDEIIIITKDWKHSAFSKYASYIYLLNNIRFCYIFFFFFFVTPCEGTFILCKPSSSMLIASATWTFTSFFSVAVFPLYTARVIKKYESVEILLIPCGSYPFYPYIDYITLRPAYLNNHTAEYNSADNGHYVWFAEW